jgi:cytochrome c-type biogenesis protein
MSAASGIGFPLAFSAGLISFLSPCVLPLVPGYLSAVAGGRPDEIRASRVIGPTLAFCGSFSFIFIALGLLGQRALRTELTGTTALKISGAVIIVMGVVFLLSSFVPAFSRTWHFDGLMERAGRGGPLLIGAAFALAWTPCTGPTLGAIVTAAGTSASASRGALLLAAYCAGLAVPFLFAGRAAEPLQPHVAAWPEAAAHGSPTDRASARPGRLQREPGQILFAASEPGLRVDLAL